MSGNWWIAIGVALTAFSAFAIPYGFYLRSKEPNAIYQRILLDSQDKPLEGADDVIVLADNIVGSDRGYMLIRVNKHYLNSSFDSPITLRYEHRRYQPVMLTFRNDARFGAGVVLVSPERERRAEIYLGQCFRFTGFGKMYFTEDLVFELYYNDYCVYFVTNSGEVRFERGLPPIRYGKNLCMGYFDPNDTEKNKRASDDFPALEAFFKPEVSDEQEP